MAVQKLNFAERVCI